MTDTATPTWDTTFDPAERYGGVTGALKAFGLGFAKSSTFGLSHEFLTKSGIMKPEDIKGYEEENPISSGVGEFGGVIGALALGPESAAAKGAVEAAELAGASAKEILAAKNAANASLKGFEAADLLNPVRTASRLGGSVTEAAAGALPQAGTTAGKILAQAGAHAAGSAIEGAAYGLGQSVSEHALGDPTLNAEKVLANLGTGAVVGGALGSLFGAAKGAVHEAFPRFLSEADKVGIKEGNWDTLAKSSDMPEADKQGFIEGLKKRKANAGEIESAAQDIGAPVLPGMVSDSKLVQKGQSALLEGPPSIPAVRAQQIAAEGFEKAEGAVSQTLGGDAEFTKATLGDTLRDMATQKIQAQQEPITALYDELKGRYEGIPISDKATKQIAGNIRKLDEVRIAPSSPEAKIALRVADEIENLTSVEDIKKYKSLLNRSVAPTASSGEKHMVSVLSEKLANLEENSIVRLAERDMKTSVAKEKVLGLLDMREAANAQYTVFRDKLQRLGEVLGKKRIYGAQDFISHLEGMTPEQIADRLSGKNNSEFLEWFSKEFPEGMDAISRYKKGMIREAAMKDGKLNIRKVLSEVDKLPKEYREKIFSADELKKMNSVRTYIDAFPKNFNPSNTANASAYRAFFENGIVGPALANARDFGIETFINAATHSGDGSSAIIDGLTKVERAAQKTTKQIGSGVSAIFSKDAGSPIKGYLAMSSTERRDHHDDMHDKLAGFGASPEKLIEHISENTQGLTDVAPQTSAAAQATMSRATQFLQSKLPQAPEQKPLSPKFKPSEAELAKWHKYFTAVERPTDALHAVAAGTLTPETMEALTVVYPKLLNEMRSAVTDKMTAAMAKKAVIPYRTKMSLSMFLGQDLVDSLNPVSMLANQNTLASATQAKNEQRMAQMSGANKKSLDKMDSSGRLLTSAQKSAQRKEA